MLLVTRSRIRCTDSTKFSRLALVQTLGATASTYREHFGGWGVGDRGFWVG